MLQKGTILFHKVGSGSRQLAVMRSLSILYGFGGELFLIRKRLIILFLSVVLISQVGFTQIQKHEYNDSLFKCVYQTNNGKIDGPYVSYYKNGIKKAEGMFESNYRTGIWTMWDATGRMRMQRNYETPFTFKRLIPVPPIDKPAVLFSAPKYTPKYNIDGFIDYFHLEERMVFMSKRLWRFIPAESNPLLFESNKFLKFLQKNTRLENITTYNFLDEEFRKPVSAISIAANNKIIGIKIQEDWFFDTERLVSETRIIGLCPVAVNIVTHDTTALYWVYFPEARKYLAEEKIKETNIPSYIKTLDDLFFYRYFSSTIYKEENVKDRKISDYKTGKDIEKEAEKIELNLIDAEHDIWIRFTK